MAAWLIPYTSGLFKIESMCLRYLSKRRDNRQWLGMIDSLIALAYLRFRPGAKLHIRGFKITNDHSHQLQIRDYQLDFQGIKRSILGGSSTDMLNLKTPIYYSYQVLADLAPDDRQIILQLALESVIYLQEDTYVHDLNALEYLHTIQLLLVEMLKVYGTDGAQENTCDDPEENASDDPEENASDGPNRNASENASENASDNLSENADDGSDRNASENASENSSSDIKNDKDTQHAKQLNTKKLNRDPTKPVSKFPNSQLETYLCIKSDYLEHPYTQENLQIWKNNLPLLREICHQFKQAHERYLHGGAYEENLNQIREAANRMRHMMNDYVENIEKI